MYVLCVKEKTQILTQIKKSLLENSDTKYQEAIQGFVVGGDAQVYGVRVPQLKKIAGILKKDLTPLSDVLYLDFCNSLYNQPSREEMLLSCYLIDKKRPVLDLIDWPLLEKWSNKVDNWENNDVLSLLVIGPWVSKNPEERLNNLKNWILSKNLWHRRLTLVSLIISVRSGKLWQESLQLVDKVKRERDPMIVKAVSWLLREMVRKNAKKEVADYVSANRSFLSSLVVREVENKLATGLKNPKKK